MKKSDIPGCRLINQQIAESKYKKPHQIISWLVAMQSQVFTMTKWGMALRVQGLNSIDIEKEFNSGKILRTHLLRPTWHFVTPADIRWLLKLTAPRVNAFNASIYRKLELDNALFERSNTIFIKALQGGNHLTRTTLKLALERSKIQAEGIRLACIIMHAELDGIICSGALQGKQFTYALLEERVPPLKALEKKEALAELTKRYFASRGPATINDFVWWSGLTIKEAKEGIELVKLNFIHEVIDDKEYIFLPAETRNLNKLQTTFLLPDYDEYGISYKDRSAIFINKDIDISRGNFLFNHMIVVDGTIAGTWRQVIKNKAIGVETSFYKPLNKRQQKVLSYAIKKYMFVNNEIIKDYSSVYITTSLHHLYTEIYTLSYLLAPMYNLFESRRSIFAIVL